MVIQGVTYLSDFEAKKAIIAAAARLEAKGDLPAGDGTITVRVGPNAVWTTLAGSNKAALTQEQMIRVDMNGKAMGSANPKPLPEDLSIHLKIYQENKDVQCVIHGYPVCAALLGMEGKSLEPGTFTPAVRRLGRVQCLPVKAVPEQASAVSLLCATDHVTVIQGDGCFSWGKTPTDAVNQIDALRYYCQVLDQASQSRQSNCQHTCSQTGCTCRSQDCDQPVPQNREMPPVEQLPVLPGVTGLICPGGSLPPLPSAEPPVMTPAAPTPAPVEASAPVAAVDAPKEDVMAEVIRKTLAMLG